MPFTLRVLLRAAALVAPLVRCCWARVLRAARVLIPLRFPLVVAAVGCGCVLAHVEAAMAADAGRLWRWPLGGIPVVVRGFDPPPVPWAPGHRGVDLRARAGDPVFAAGSGVVGYAGLLAGRGVVAVHHPGGLETTYEPVASAVRAGQRVRAGAVLGRVEAGHGNCGAGFVCLHWGLREGDRYLDPLSLVRPRVVRLLPIWPGGAPPVVSADAATAGPRGRSAHAPTAPSPDGGATAQTSDSRGGAATQTSAGVVGAAGALGAAGVAAGVLRRRRRRAPP